MVHCHPLVFLVAACWLLLPPCLSTQPPCSAGLFLISTQPLSALCVYGYMMSLLIAKDSCAVKLVYILPRSPFLLSLSHHSFFPLWSSSLCSISIEHSELLSMEKVTWTFMSWGLGQILQTVLVCLFVCVCLFSFGIMKVPHFQNGSSPAEVASATSSRCKIRKTHFNWTILYTLHMHSDRNSD